MNPNGTFTPQEIKMIMQKQEIERMRRDAIRFSGFGTVNNMFNLDIETFLKSIALEKELQTQLKGGHADV